jgi:putative N6-adenine-specific DNA methylase
VSSSRSTFRSEQKFFATCPRGLEKVLSEELAALGAKDLTPTEGGVGFAGALETAYRANLHSRVASRVLWEILSGRYRSEEDLYRAMRGIDWPALFDVRCTIRVNVSAIHSPVKSLEFVALRIKDAVCDRFRDEVDARPSVDTARPDVRIHVFLTERDFTAYLDTSGEALFKRGYRSDAGVAPLRENLAAGIIRLTGWTPGEALLDPMCGGATLLIEAAHLALGVTPGAKRRFGFEKLKSFDAARWQALRSESQPFSGAITHLFGSDRDRAAVDAARRNAREAGVADRMALSQGDVLAIEPPAREGVLVMNPPYGVRLEEQQRLAEFYPKLGDALKQRFAGWRAYIFTSDLRLPKLIGLAPSKRTPLYNGALECRLYEFRMVAGSARKRKGEGVKGEG